MAQHKDMCTLSFTAQSTCNDLHLQVRLDGVSIFDQTLGTDPITVAHQFEEIDGQQHCVEFDMSGKTIDHTQLENDKIISDQYITISQVALLDNELGHLLVEHSNYQHNFNGTGPVTQQNFYGIMGCNGIVRFEFSSPVYLWLLENM